MSSRRGHQAGYSISIVPVVPAITLDCKVSAVVVALGDEVIPLGGSVTMSVGSLLGAARRIALHDSQNGLAIQVFQREVAKMRVRIHCDRVSIGAKHAFARF